MKLVYTPTDGSEPQEWPIDATDLTIGEVKLLEQYSEMTMVEFGQALERGSFTAMAVLMWLFRRRNEPGLKFTDLDDIGLSQLKTVAEAEAPKDPAASDA